MPTCATEVLLAALSVSFACACGGHVADGRDLLHGTGGVAGSAGGAGGSAGAVVGGAGGGAGAGAGAGGCAADTQADPKNCGFCGHDCSACAGGSTCHDGRCDPVVLATEAGLFSIAVDATAVYGAVGVAGTVMKYPLAGGPPVALATGQSHPGGLIVAGSYLYWANGEVGTKGSIARLPLAGGPLETLAAAQDDPRRLAVDATTVYFTAANTGKVSKVPLGGGSPVLLSTGGTPQGIAVDASRIYWADGAANTVRVMPVGGGAVSDLVTGADAGWVAVDEKRVYFMGSALRAVPIGGAAVETIAAGPYVPIAFTKDATSVYTGHSDSSGTIVKIPLDGSAPVTLVQLTDNKAYDVAVDETCVYYVGAKDGALAKVAK
ncbi:MAG: hypothetical protein IPI67_13195 [Myxococcales bacterium]|nr:hypothetical protein [Myxococcales bacterium]